MKEKVLLFINNLLIYDYILFGSIILLFILLLLLAVLLRRHLISAVLIVIFALFFLMLAPIFGYKEVHNYIFKNHLENVTIKQLEFTPALVVKGEIVNDSKQIFSECKIKAKVFKVSHNKLFDMLYPINPFKKTTYRVADLNLSKDQKQEFKFFIEPFTYTKDYNTSLTGDCK